MNTDQGVSIIVLTSNGEHDIRRLLQTFLQKNTCSSVEFIIVDHSPHAPAYGGSQETGQADGKGRFMQYKALAHVQSHGNAY